MDKQTFTVPAADNSKRLDKFLAEQTGVSRGRIQELIEATGDKPSRKIMVGEEVSIEIPDSKPLDLEPWDFPLDVVFENDDMLVINKPVGLTVHPAPGNYEKTLVHALLHHCGGSLSGINGIERPGIVHRLDKNTSGVMVVAKNDEAHNFLAKNIEKKKILRHYKAIVAGIPNPPSDIIETMYGRDKTDRKKMRVLDDGGKIAITEYKVSQVLGRGKASVVDCQLQTGRTHQIRVHMRYIGCPIIGDDVYTLKQKTKNLPEFHRQALHAYKLVIPDVGEFEAEMPQDMQELIANLS